MKKKFISLLMAFVLVLSSTMVVSAEETLTRPQEWAEALGLPEVSGADAIAQIGKENTVFLDLRAAADYEAGHIKGTVSAPVCLPAPGYEVPVSNRDAFVAQMEELKVAENNTTIYLSCYAGTFCVDFAADWLINNCGVKAEQLVRVKGGTFGDADLAANSVFVSSEYALNEVEKGGSLILDLRATEVYYENGYLDKSLHAPLFNRVDGKNVVTDRKDELAKNFNAFVEANYDLLESNKIYLLCNGGASGAAAATFLLGEAGLTDNVFTIEGGANKLIVDRPELFVKQQFIGGREAVYVTGTATVPSATDVNAVVIDVRAVERYDVGHLKGAPSYPVFTVDASDKNVVTSGYDKLAMDFLAKVEANAKYFEGKDIYLICNSGASGAKAATKLLMQAGYSNSNIYTVEGGAKGVATGDNADMSVPENLTFVSPAQAKKVVGNSDYIILDVRAVERYEAGTLEGSVNVPLFTVDENNNNVPVKAPYDDELSMAFKKYVADNKEVLASKTIYILCNSGESGARNANTLLAEAGLTKVFTIDGGAKAFSDLKAPGVDNNDDSTTAPDKTPESGDSAVAGNKTESSTPKTGDTAPIMGYVLVMGLALAVIVSKKKLTK